MKYLILILLFLLQVKKSKQKTVSDHWRKPRRLQKNAKNLLIMAKVYELGV